MTIVNNFSISLILSARFVSDAPFLEVFLDGEIISSNQVTSKIGVSTFTFDSSVSIGDVLPSSLSFRFGTDSSPELNRSIRIDEVSVNDHNIDISELSISSNAIASPNAISLNSVGDDTSISLIEKSFLLGTTEPTLEDLGTATLTGTTGVDNLVATANHDVISGGAGNDRISALAGDDRVFGGAGNDRIFGHDGDDILVGGLGNDLLFGRNDNDILFGGEGNDRLVGDDGDDILNGGVGDDNLFGGLGNDALYGGADHDRIVAGDGDDIADGGDGRDQIYGGAGNDTIDGGLESDLLDGEDGDDILNGGAGADRILSGTGNDILNGGDGNDILIAQGGINILNGDLGDDELFAGSLGDTLNGGDGNDNLSGGAGIDTLNGDDGNDRILAGSGNDIIDGGAGDDDLYGDAGDDTIHGGAGLQDSIYGGFGSDTLYGEEGFDRIFGDEGNDFISGGLDNDLLRGGLDNDTVNGDEGNDRLFGDEGNDILNGGLGSDRLRGGEGDDILNGNDGNDRLFGDLGNDILNGGAGNDVINGGEGLNDIVIFSGNRLDYTITQNASIFTLVDERAIDGTDTVTNVQIFRFNDGDVNVADIISEETITGTAGNDTLVSGSVPAGNNSFIQDILDNNPQPVTGQNGTQDLIYNSDTGNFYQYIFAFFDATGIESAITAGTINGVAGNLVTFETPEELSFVLSNLGTDFGGGPNFQNNTIVGDSDTSAAIVTSTPLTTLNANGSFGSSSGFSPFIVEFDGNEILGSNNTPGTGLSATLSGGAGNDQLFGGDGLDIFLFENATAFGAGNRDQIFDFDQKDGDVIDLSDVLSGLNVDAENIEDFVQIDQFNGVRVDVSGSGQFFDAGANPIATFSGTVDIINGDEAALIANGNLII